MHGLLLEVDVAEVEADRLGAAQPAPSRRARAARGCAARAGRRRRRRRGAPRPRAASARPAAGAAGAARSAARARARGRARSGGTSARPRAAARSWPARGRSAHARARRRTRRARARRPLEARAARSSQAAKCRRSTRTRAASTRRGSGRKEAVDGGVRSRIALQAMFPRVGCMSFRARERRRGAPDEPRGAAGGRLRERRHRVPSARHVERLPRVARRPARAGVVPSWVSRGPLPGQVVAPASSCASRMPVRRSRRREQSGAEEVALLGFSMGGAVAVHVAADAAVRTVIALAPWLYPELDLSPLDGRRLAIVHGSLDRAAPGCPGRAAGAVAARLRAGTGARRRRRAHRRSRAGCIRSPCAPPWGEPVRDASGRALGRARRRRAGATSARRALPGNPAPDARALHASSTGSRSAVAFRRAPASWPRTTSRCSTRSSSRSRPTSRCVSSRRQELWRTRAGRLARRCAAARSRSRAAAATARRSHGAEALLAAGGVVGDLPRGRRARRWLAPAALPGSRSRPAPRSCRSDRRVGARALARAVGLPRVACSSASRSPSSAASRPSWPRARADAGAPGARRRALVARPYSSFGMARGRRSFEASEPVERPADPAVRRANLRRIVRLFRPTRQASRSSGADRLLGRPRRRPARSCSRRSSTTALPERRPDGSLNCARRRA